MNMQVRMVVEFCLLLHCDLRSYLHFFVHRLISTPPPHYRQRGLNSLPRESKKTFANILSSTSSDGGATDATDGADATRLVTSFRLIEPK